MAAGLLLLPSWSWACHSEVCSPYDGWFARYGVRYLPEYEWHHLVAQCRQESGPDFNTYARSPVGALGVCQFMKPTWDDMQLKLGFIASRTNPKHNIRAAAYYMSRLLYVWRGRERTPAEKLPLAQSSYNCGTGCVLRAQQKAADARDWEDVAPFLPEEARSYVLHIRRHYQRMTEH